MLGMAPDYENLTVIQKVEVFEHALESTSGEPALTPLRPPLSLSGPYWAVVLIISTQPDPSKDARALFRAASRRGWQDLQGRQGQC